MNKLLNLLVLTAMLGIVSRVAAGQTVTKIIDHGQDGEKQTFVVLGDGYSATDQTKFANDVDTLVVKGVFGHDFYKDNIDAFNLYRVDLISHDSGVSNLTFAKNTALKVIYSGSWSRCWLEESKATDQLITQAASKIAKYDYVLIIANESGYGGCRRGSRLYVTSGDNWDVVAHEYGHGIAGLYDEYSVDGRGAYSDTPINIKNCSTVLNRSSVVWNQLIDGTIDLPSDNSQSADPNQTVGEFTGCNYAQTKIYRPVKDCRMNSNTPNFCPVCLGLMHEALAPFLAQRAAPLPQPAQGQSGNSPSDGQYMNVIIRISKTEKPAVLKATEVTGNLISSQHAAPAYFFAFTKDSQPIFADFLPEDPYLVRGFADPKHMEKGENLTHGDSSTIVVNIPKTDIASATHNLGMQLYSVQPGFINNLADSASFDPSHLVNILIQNPGVKKELDWSQAALGSAVGAKAIQAKPQ